MVCAACANCKQLFLHLFALEPFMDVCSVQSALLGRTASAWESYVSCNLQLPCMCLCSRVCNCKQYILSAEGYRLQRHIMRSAHCSAVLCSCLGNWNTQYIDSGLMCLVESYLKTVQQAGLSVRSINCLMATVFKLRQA